MRLAFSAVALLLFVGPALSQAFNCDFAKLPDEITICRDDSLKALDEKMADAFFSVRQQLDKDGQGSMNRLQKQFLKNRNFCGTDGNCIATEYEAQMQAICTVATERGVACP
jgi:uncharacterized protein